MINDIIVCKSVTSLGGRVAPVARHARPRLPDHPHAVAEGGAADQPRPLTRPPPRALQRGGERVQVHLHVVVRLGHVRHVSTVLVSPHVTTQDLLQLLLQTKLREIQEFKM